MTTTRYARVTVEQDEVNGQGTDNKIVRWITKLAQWLVWVISIVPLFLAKVISFFFGGIGVLAISAVVFFAGVLVNANSYWQALGQYSFFPWYYETPWTGWASWGNIITSILFWMALIVSIATSVIQGKAVRGKGVEINKAEFEEWNQHSIPSEPGESKLEMAKISWRRLKSSGVAQNRFVSYGALAAWAFEFTVSFAQNNPFRFSEPGLILGCIFYIVATGFAPEFGYAMWNDAIDNFKLQDRIAVDQLGRE